MMFQPKKYRKEKLDNRFTLLDMHAKDGTYLEGVVFTPPHYKESIFYLGGNAQDSVGLIYKLSTCYENYQIFTFNYRGYGNSKGVTSEKKLYEDVLHVSGLFSKRFGDFSVMGYSLGTSLGAFIATKQKVNNLFLLGAFDSIKALAKARFPWIPSWLVCYNFTTVAYSQEISCDTYLVYSNDDGIVLKQNTLNLKAHLKKLVDFKELNGYNHHELLCTKETIELITKVLH